MTLNAFSIVPGFKNFFLVKAALEFRNRYCVCLHDRDAEVDAEGLDTSRMDAFRHSCGSVMQPQQAWLRDTHFARSSSASICSRCASFRGLLAIVLSGTFQIFAADRVVGANATLEINAGARSAALGGTILAVDEDILGMTSNPYQLAQTSAMWAGFSHVAYYEGTQYDYAAMVLPLGDFHGLGISFSRFGADDIPWIKEGDAIPEGSDYNTLNIADYVFSAAWGKRFGKLDMGVAFHGLYRELDQTGWGFRGDAGARYQLHPQISLSTFLKGWTSSAASWESGTYEYSSPELYVAGRYDQPIPYFYGTFRLLWQSAGIFHREDRDLDWDGEVRGGRLWDHPADWVLGGHAGAEFAFDFGLSLRGGLASMGELQSWTAGAGLELASWLKVDYAFESHPVLSAVHRVSICVSPSLFMYPPHKSATTSSKALQKKSSSVSTLEPVEEAEQTEKHVEESAGGISWEE
jgi:hypothetical protein